MVDLQKGQKIDVTRNNPGIKNILVGLGWDEAEKALKTQKGFLGKLEDIGQKLTTKKMDCDASVFLLKNGRLESNRDVVYFANLNHFSGSVIHMGDNKSGSGEGDDEQVRVLLDKVPDVYDRIVFVANVFKSANRAQHFGMIKNAFIRVTDADSKQEICRFNLTEDYAGMTAVVCGEMYRHNGEWKFTAVGQGSNEPGLTEFSKRYA